VHQIRAADLASLYAATGSSNAVIGALSQDDSIPAYVDVADMLSKHFAVLGSTGCGKSASVSLLLHAAQEIIPDLRTITLDPHNEYSRAFPEANTIEQSNLDLPFWMFQLEEYVEVLFRGKPLVHEEVDALREFIPNAKAKFRDGEDRVKLRTDSNSSAFTADTAVPYRMADLLSEIDEEMGLLESRYDKSVLKSLKARINAHTNDSRYAFMFRHRTIEDIAAKVIGNFFGLPGTGALSTIIQMAGMPAEVVNSVASVLCRLSFELAIAAKGNLKILVVCEEAHRYVPAGKGGFEPTRRAIARIAKEGRKYGSFMAIISQRPSELDPTILSQCSTVFSLRLTNDFDQEIIRKAISSSSASTIAFISSLSNRECIAFGEGMSTPMRMKFRNLPKQWLPGAEADVFGNSVEIRDQQQCAQVFQQWRGGAR
jgi:DNA helicase HerA-like ATPase